MVSLPAFSSFLLTMTPASFLVFARSFRLFVSTYRIFRESQRIIDLLLRVNSPASSDVKVSTASSIAVRLSLESELPRTRRLSSWKPLPSEFAPMKKSSSRDVSRDVSRSTVAFPLAWAAAAAAAAAFFFLCSQRCNGAYDYDRINLTGTAHAETG